jgi:hypothetical protein
VWPRSEHGATSRPGVSATFCAAEVHDDTGAAYHRRVSGSWAASRQLARCFQLRVRFDFVVPPGGALSLAMAFPAILLASEVVSDCSAAKPGPAYYRGVPMLPDGTQGFTGARYGTVWGATLTSPRRHAGSPSPSTLPVTRPPPLKSVKRPRPASACDEDMPTPSHRVIAASCGDDEHKLLCLGCTRCDCSEMHCYESRDRLTHSTARRLDRSAVRLAHTQPAMQPCHQARQRRQYPSQSWLGAAGDRHRERTPQGKGEHPTWSSGCQLSQRRRGGRRMRHTTPSHLALLEPATLHITPTGHHTTRRPERYQQQRAIPCVRLIHSRMETVSAPPSASTSSRRRHLCDTPHGIVAAADGKQWHAAN